MTHSLIRAEIDLGAIGQNVSQLRRITSPSAKLMAVVKANGYGHGAVPVAVTALKNGADRLGVARMEEGKQLREAGIEAPILLFGLTHPDQVDDVIRHGLTPTVFSLENAKLLSEKIGRRSPPLGIHLKIDTGMGRIGLLPDALCADPAEKGSSARLLEIITRIIRLPGLQLEGIYTHFASADSADKTYTRLQLKRFLDILEKLRRSGIDTGIRHAANSGGIIDHPESHLDMVRPGISLYGLYPSPEVTREKLPLIPAMALKTTIIQIKEVPAGFKISYGSTYETTRITRIATLSIGYADGLNRLLSSRGWMLVHGVRAPIVGRVCMDLTMIDVGHIPDAKAGDEVVVFGRQNNAELHVDEIADMLDTINYEVVTGISERVPRAYVNA